MIHKENGGLSSARNTGMVHINARYLMFVDSDDYLAENAVQKLMEKAYAEDADIVCGAHTRAFEDKSELYTHFDSDTKVDDISRIPGLAWGKVYRSELFQNIVYPEKYWYEDTITRFLLFRKAKSIFYVNSSVYNYRIINTSISHSNKGKPRNIESFWVTEIIIDDYKKLNLPIDDKFLKMVLGQAKVNGRRIRTLDINIQEAVFVLTRNIITETFDSKLLGNDDVMLKFFVNNDFGGYRLYFKTH